MPAARKTTEIVVKIGYWRFPRQNCRCLIRIALEYGAYFQMEFQWLNSSILYLSLSGMKCPTVFVTP